MTVGRATIDKSGVMGLNGHVVERVSGVTGSHDTPVSEPDGSVTRRFLLSPEVRNNRKGGLNDHKISARSIVSKTHRTNHHNFQSLLSAERRIEG
jgi:hypothetical protein